MRRMNEKGFTLVELMVVLAILGILAAIGIPQYTRVMERSRVGADYATIATVQTAFDVFLAEVGGIDNVEVGAVSKVVGDTEAASPSVIKGRSLVTNKDVTFAAFWDGTDVFPTLKSSELTPTKWVVTDGGTITAVKKTP